MASQTFTIGAPSSEISGFNGQIKWDPAVNFGPIDTDLIVSGATAYLSLFNLRASGNDWISPQLQTDTGTTNIGSGSGPELVPEWETYASAVIIRAGDLELTLIGPDHPDVATQDATEPYTWFLTTADNFEAFVTAYMALSDDDKAATTLTLRDSPPDPIDLSGTAATGNPATAGALAKQFFGKELAGSIATGDPATAGALEVVAAPVLLSLDDFSGPDSQQYDILALFTTGANNTNVIVNLGTDIGSVEDGGDIVFDDLSNKTITRFQARTAPGITINAAGGDDFSGGFEDADGAYRDATVYVQTLADGLATMTVDNPDELGSAGGGFVSFFPGVSDTQSRTVITNLRAAAIGTRFILAVGRPPTVIDLAGSAATGDPVTTGALAVVPAVNVDLSGSAATGDPATAGALAVVPVVNVDLAGSAATGDPTAAGTLAVVAAGNVDLTGTAATGDPTTTGTLDVVTITDVDISGSAATGDPTTTGTLEVIPVGNVDLSGSAATGDPTTTGTLEVIPVGNVDLSGSAATGDPTVAGTLEVLPAGAAVADVDLSGSMATGVPYTIAFIETAPGPIVPRLTGHVDLLLEQYADASRLRSLLSGFAALVDADVIDILTELGRGFSPVESEGILLDWIGLRLGLLRPYVRSSDATYFGFAGTMAEGGRTFGQAPFLTRRAFIEDVAPIGDITYRVLLRARARRLRGGSDRKTLLAVLDVLSTRAYAEEDFTTDTVAISMLPVSDPVYNLATDTLRTLLIPMTPGIGYTFTKLVS